MSSWTLAFFLLVFYFLPTIIGRSRGVTSLGSVFVINLFLGWTLIGWVVALAMASRSVEPKPRKERPAKVPDPEKWWTQKRRV